MPELPGTGRHVVVVGGGVIGLTTAVVLAEAGAAVEVRTREEAAHTTSAVAGGLWEPYRIGPPELAEAWARESFADFTALAARPAETGVRLADGLQAAVGTGEIPLPSWTAGVPGLRRAAPGELPPGYGSGFRIRLPLADMPAYLGHLTRRLRAAGGTVTVREVRDLAAAGPADTVVNCTGLGARELTGDRSMRPIRGQLVVVANPGVTEWFVDTSEGDPTYFFPQPYGLLLGGTSLDGVGDTGPDPRTAVAIVARCARVDPRIAGAAVLAHRVGLRPFRPEVRLEREGRVVHNYGHGGAGVTVSWGCARAAARLALAD